MQLRDILVPALLALSFVLVVPVLADVVDTMRVEATRLVPLRLPGENRSDPVAIGSRAAVAPRDLEASLRPAKRRFRVGDAPEFRARIRNRGDATVLLVHSVDASDAWASPRVTIKIEGPDSGFVVPRFARCGNFNGVSSADIAEVVPGGEFDPYARGWLGQNLRSGRFQKPGRYTATFRYVTTETDPHPWGLASCGGNPPAGGVCELLTRVPAVALTATTTFEVVR